jgi:hypothetical protein
MPLNVVPHWVKYKCTDVKWTQVTAFKIDDKAETLTVMSA